MTDKIKMTMDQARVIVKMNKMDCDDCCMLKQCNSAHDGTSCSDVVLQAASMVHGQENDWHRETATKCLVAMYEAGFDASVDHVEKIIERVDLLDAALKENKKCTS